MRRASLGHTQWALPFIRRKMVENNAVNLTNKLIMYRTSTYFLVVIVFSILLSCKGNKQEPTARPNILFIMSDDHAYQSISAYSDRLIKTPNIDQTLEVL